MKDALIMQLNVYGTNCYSVFMHRLPVNCFNYPWTDDLYCIVINTVRLLTCVNMLSKER